MDRILGLLGQDRTHLSTKITKVESLPNAKITVTSDSGSVDDFDHVIMACHSDTALDILESGNITRDEQRILEKFSWADNEIFLHQVPQCPAVALVCSFSVKLQCFLGGAKGRIPVATARVLDPV